ncbi:energy-coupling factor ABC transporter substrate-binding protein [Tessaracoccus antarcticus]|nr:energy-coupling factor ABC transporter substrate-binding protein [Tessaracoccus antarcticus]
MREHRRGMTWGVASILLAVLVAIFAVSFFLAPDASEGDESFAGTDSTVTAILEERGIEPWFTPIFEPGSGEIESGLFALQAALGAGLLGFALGNLHGRSASRREQAEPTPPASPGPMPAE